MKYNMFKITYKYVFGILSFISIYTYYFYKLFSRHDLDVYNFNYEIYSLDYFTTFTLISNVLCQIWLLWAAIQPKKEGYNKFLSQTTALTFSVMITITFIVYNFILVPLDTGFPTHPYDAFATVVNHIITPIAFIIYFIFFMNNKNTIILNQFFIKKFWIQFVILFGYCIFSLIKGELRYKSNSSLYEKPGGGNTWYPYFFLNIHNSSGPLGIPGIGWFFIAFFLIISVMVGFTYLYNFLSNKLIKKNQ
ncbi:Pr6Pr family membrane protein [Spiroplasma turonicum]|uniref:Transmembrane protein n=1 Tax=Spiroplasma turonicum TaxID=216946 RepID=A0A0K1P672_9MOLU|nr:Pr6Pr family membrane protein [Spiroplasma turonicum]AKU79765.1 hypothetical protein STURON_00519 [Spiroplasma turonicum]ALX70783.1 hypothetical protein STURO_v1c05170 [Spiroplasma turonicum]